MIVLNDHSSGLSKSTTMTTWSMTSGAVESSFDLQSSDIFINGKQAVFPIAPETPNPFKYGLKKPKNGNPIEILGQSYMFILFE